jgi:hypothetical protein
MEDKDAEEEDENEDEEDDDEDEDDDEYKTADVSFTRFGLGVSLSSEDATEEEDV